MSAPPTGQGFGKGKWGTSQWGSGLGAAGTAPVITPLDPIDDMTDVPAGHPVFVRVTDDVGVAQGSLKISLGPVVYVFGGSAQNGATLTLTPNGGNGFDLELRAPAPYPAPSIQVVTVEVSDINGNAAILTYHFHVGIGLRMLQVRNPQPNILLAYFNKPLRQDAALVFPPNWVITPVSVGAAPLQIVEAVANVNHPDSVTLRYTGGGSIYRLMASMAVDDGGSGIDEAYNSAEFEIVFGDEAPATVRLFNTIYGPMGITHRVRQRRTMDQHVVNRSLALGVDEQFRLRLQTMDSSADRTGRPGRNRT